MSLMLVPMIVYNNLACMYTSHVCELADYCVLNYCAYWDVRCFGSRFKKTDNICKIASAKKKKSFMEHCKQRQHKMIQVKRQQGRHIDRRNKFEHFEMHYIFGPGEGAELSF